MKTKRRWVLQTLIALGALMGIGVHVALNWEPAPPEEVHYPPERVAAWNKIGPRLRAADTEARRVAEERHKQIRAFFAERENRARAFANDVLSLSGKWEFIKSKVDRWGDENYRAFLRESFEKNVLSGGEIEQLLEQVISGYVVELQGTENQLLVDVRADLADTELGQLDLGPALETDQAFRERYARALGEISAIAGRDMPVWLSKEAVTWVGADIAANITVSLSIAIAERLGISAGILGTGAASGVATLGIGIGAAIILDGLVDRLLQAAGHDPAGDIAGKVIELLQTFEGMLLDGDAQAVRTYEQLRKMQENDRFEFVRLEARKAADRIEGGGYLGLRRKFDYLAESRARLRSDALRELILVGGKP